MPFSERNRKKSQERYEPRNTLHRKGKSTLEKEHLEGQRVQQGDRVAKGLLQNKMRRSSSLRNLSVMDSLVNEKIKGSSL